MIKDRSKERKKEQYRKRERDNKIGRETDKADRKRER